MTDKELLEQAANAAAIEIWFDDNGTPWFDGDKYVWNPLVDDGDALRLAVKFGMHIGMCDDAVLVTCAGHIYRQLFEWHNDDPYAATRRAIVRAAAEIGKGMK